MEFGFDSIFHNEGLSSTAINPKIRDKKKIQTYYKLLETTNNNFAKSTCNNFDRGEEEQDNLAEINLGVQPKIISSITIAKDNVINSTHYLELQSQYNNIKLQYETILNKCNNMENQFIKVLELLKKRKRNEGPEEVVKT